MESTAVDQSIWNKIFKGELEVNRFGLIAVLLLIVGCLGGVTVGLGAIESTVQLTLVVVPTMTALTLLLAVAPMKYIMTASAIAIDLLILLINFI